MNIKNSPDRVTLLMLGMTAGNLLLFLLRNAYLWYAGLLPLAREGYLTFTFLVWNLFLAWLPYLFSLAILNKERTRLELISLLFLWVLFLPNAPYILTDFIHLHSRPPVPIWFDLITLFAFAWTGLLLGALSISNAERGLSLGGYRRWGRLLPWLVIRLSSLGIYFGRFLRWNSWDVFTQPIDLFLELLAWAEDPAWLKNLVFILFPLTMIQTFVYIWIRHFSSNSSPLNATDRELSTL